MKKAPEEKVVAELGKSISLELPQGIRKVEVVDIRGKIVWTYYKESILEKVTITLPNNLGGSMRVRYF